MNSTIKVMVELQHYWDKVLSSRSSIDKINANLKALGKDLADATSGYETLNKKVKELKNAIKQNELSLTEMSGRITKLEDRKKIIHTEKELHALEKEIDVIRFDSGNLEEKTLSMIDDLDSNEKKLSALQADVEDKARLMDAEKEKTLSEITGHEAIIRENTDKFNAMTDQLPTQYKSKFIKMISSRDGRGVAHVEGEICGFCNFKIPSFLAIDASKDEKLVNCTNCGKYIYK